MSGKTAKTGEPGKSKNRWWKRLFDSVDFSNKSTKSKINFGLAFLVGFLSFLPAWLIIHNFINLPMPDFVNSAEDWKFWSSLVISLIFSAIVLLTANAVSEEKNKWTKGIPWVILFIIFCWTVDYYGCSRKVELKDQSEIVEQIIIDNPNPYSHKTPAYSFHLNEGEKSQWIDWKIGYRLNTWGNFKNYKIIYEDGRVFTVRGGDMIRNLPNPGGNTKIRLESLSDNQEIHVYLTKL